MRVFEIGLEFVNNNCSQQATAVRTKQQQQQPTLKHPPPPFCSPYSNHDHSKDVEEAAGKDAVPGSEPALLALAFLIALGILVNHHQGRLGPATLTQGAQGWAVDAGPVHSV